MDRGDLEREQDIEELRRVALVQQTQIEQLLAVLANKSREIDQLRGKGGWTTPTERVLAVADS